MTKNAIAKTSSKENNENEGSLGEAKLSDYEQLRAANIARNNARLRALGLISAREEFLSNHNYNNHRPVVGDKIDEDDEDEWQEEEGENSIHPRKRRTKKKRTLTKTDPLPVSYTHLTLPTKA